MAPPIYVKGGVWTNVEDQILKAAVSKYGLTQWARVASLLPKKTAKQAKARWNEYLNPALKASAWEKSDDAKLLDLAKLLPNQWRSVAQIMGRTATQCVERYQKLLESVVNGSDAEENEENVDFTGPGIEALPALGNAYESLPSRPDAEDMDEDEQEMLSEAKARLGNTQGKKAKRKDRERLLQESRRIALLQKRRELKAAGVNISLTSKNKARRKDFDYNGDIPHERVPLEGKYDSSAEEARNLAQVSAFQKQVSAKGLGDGAKKPQRESRAAIKSAAAAVSSVDEQQAKRRKLDLPEPGASDSKAALDSHILQTSRQILGHDRPSPSPARKVSKRKIIQEFKKSLSSLPQPQVEKQVAFHEPPSASGPAVASAALHLLQQVEEVSVSPVVRRGLPIPAETAFEAGTSDPITQQILHEARRLAKSDHDQYVKSLPPQADALDQKSRDQAELLVRGELALGAKFEAVSVRDYKLPQSEHIVDTIYELLHDLNASCVDVERSISNSQMLGSQTRSYTGICERIRANSAELSNIGLELATCTSFMHDEELAIQTRSATLSDLVESVRAAEKRVQVLDRS